MGHKTLLGFILFHLLFLWAAGAASRFWNEHPPFMAPWLAQLHPSHYDPWGSGVKAGVNTDLDCRVNRQLPVIVTAPIPCG